MRVSGKVSIYWAAIFKVGSCECLSFVSICCLVGGWLLGGMLRAGPVALMRGRKGELEGGRRRGDIYVYVYIPSWGKREERSYRERCKGREFVLPCNVSQQQQQQHQLKQLPSTHQNIQIYPSRYTQQPEETPSSRVNRCIHQNLSSSPLSKQSNCPASTSLQLKLD